MAAVRRPMRGIKPTPKPQDRYEQPMSYPGSGPTMMRDSNNTYDYMAQSYGPTGKGFNPYAGNPRPGTGTGRPPTVPPSGPPVPYEEGFEPDRLPDPLEIIRMILTPPTRIKNPPSGPGYTG